MEKREAWIDYIKGWLICFVVLGHSIQYVYCQGTDYWNKGLFKLIYSFHMPMFSMVSGYLFFSYVNRYSLEIGVKRRLMQILVPCLIWGSIDYLLATFIFKRTSFSVYSIVTFIGKSNWFLWAMLYCSIALLVAWNFDKARSIVILVMILLAYLLPDYLNSIGFKMMLPFFAFGFFLKQIGGVENAWKLRKYTKVFCNSLSESNRILTI